jgi:hypothetical protein
MSEDAVGGQTAASVANVAGRRRTMKGRGLLTWGGGGGWGGGRGGRMEGERWLDADRDRQHAHPHRPQP